jgi:hypothetical protein
MLHFHQVSRPKKAEDYTHEKSCLLIGTSKSIRSASAARLPSRPQISFPRNPFLTSKTHKLLFKMQIKTLATLFAILVTSIASPIGESEPGLTLESM